MKKITNLVLFTFAGSALMAQTATEIPAVQYKADKGQMEWKNQTASKTSAVSYWSEDFAAGIPAGWTNECLDAIGNVNTAPGADWNYRGPSTSPANDTGSLGGYSSFDPIASPTAANGFVIFDSDFLDNAGIAGNFGNGIAPTPHTGVLTTDTIDLSAAAGQQLQLRFNSYARKFTADFLIVYSIDGGTTWTDTVDVYSALGVNNATATNATETFVMPAAMAGASNAMIRFVMTGPDAYYFWMLDDIEISDLPKHAVDWTPWQGAPEHDIIYNANGASPKYGRMTLKQVRSIEFDSNVLNKGSETQTNCKLDVEIWTGGSIVTTLSSPVAASMASGDTLNYNDLVTPAWTPTAEGAYTMVYKFVSDSINGVDYPYLTDTFYFLVSEDVMSLDFGTFSNSIGTDMSDIQAIGSQFDFLNDERLFSVDLRLSTVSEAGGFIEIEVYDTAGFDFSAATPGTNLAYGSYTLGSADPGTVINIPVQDANGNVPYMTAGSYVIVARMSNANGEVRIANDGTFNQPGVASIMYISGAQWYTGFNNSTTLESPWIHAITCPAATAAACMSVGIEEETELTGVKAYPNPTNGYINISMEEAGSYEMNVINMVGQTVISNEVEVVANGVERLDLSTLTPGVYFLNIVNGERVGTFKLTVQ